MKADLSRNLNILILTAALSAILPAVAHAQWLNEPFSVLDISFSDDTYGSEPVTLGYPPFPGLHPQVVGYFNTNNAAIYTAAPGATHIVGDAAGLTKALILTSDPQGDIASVGANFVDHNFNPTIGGFLAERGGLSFDFAVLQTPTSPNGQVGPNTPNGQDFILNAFLDGGLPAIRFATTHTSASGGDIQIRFPGQPSTNLFTIGTYTTGVATHVEISFDNVNRTVNVLLDGSFVIEGLPYVFAGANTNIQLKELFFFQNGVSGQPNIVALDNISYLAVPEPSSVLLGLSGLIALVGILRRRSNG